MNDCKFDFTEDVGWCDTHERESSKCKEIIAREMAWVGFDFDGTIATHDNWIGEFEFGDPIPSMIEHIKKILAQGFEVRIVTARMSETELADRMKTAIQDWLEKQGLPRLEVTNAKDYMMLCLYDDRAVSMETNTGRVIGHDRFFGKT